MDLLLVILGWTAHHLKVLKQIHTETGVILMPSSYIKKRPFKFILSIVGTTMGVIFVMFTLHPDIQTLVSDPAVADGIYLGAMGGVGVLGDLVADKFGSMAAKKLK